MSEAGCGSCETHAHSTTTEAAAPEQRTSLPWMVAVAGAAIGAGWLAGRFSLNALSLILYLLAIGLSIPKPAQRAWTSLRARVLDINLLMLIAVVGAVALGEWLEGATVVWLFGLAQWLEARSMHRARHAIRSLMTLAPSVAVIRRDGQERQVPVGDVRVGDVVVVRPGERIPVDGVVVSGVSAVNQAPVTGESWPADKSAGDDVFAGTINGVSALEVEARRPASDSTLARIIHLVEHAQSRRAPVQTFVDRFARWYTPAIAVLALLVAVAPPLVIGGVAGWSVLFPIWSYRALALLVVACPCALVISTPVAIVSALTAAARVGVLIKGGA